MGGDFSLGYQREGNATYLAELGKSMNFTVHELHNFVMWNGDSVSSSRIRRSLASGNMGDVSGRLGRMFSFEGEVVQGDQRGRTIGFPTANLDVWEKQLLPGKGVYATYAWLGDERYSAASNVGVRPTVNGAASQWKRTCLTSKKRSTVSGSGWNSLPTCGMNGNSPAWKP